MAKVADILREITRGCEMYVIREGYEGLVRGNSEYVGPPPALEDGLNALQDAETVPSLLNSLRFGDGYLLRNGTGDFVGGRTLKGRYIVRVGWDDVRGWFAEVRARLAYLPNTTEVVDGGSRGVHS